MLSLAGLLAALRQRTRGSPRRCARGREGRALLLPLEPGFSALRPVRDRALLLSQKGPDLSESARRGGRLLHDAELPTSSPRSPLDCTALGSSQPHPCSLDFSSSRQAQHEHPDSRHRPAVVPGRLAPVKPQDRLHPPRPRLGCVAAVLSLSENPPRPSLSSRGSPSVIPRSSPPCTSVHLRALADTPLDLFAPAGGAERLIVDAAVALQKRGHEVEVFTSYHEPGKEGRSFDETRDGASLSFSPSKPRRAATCS